MSNGNSELSVLQGDNGEHIKKMLLVPSLTVDLPSTNGYVEVFDNHGSTISKHGVIISVEKKVRKQHFYQKRDFYPGYFSVNMRGFQIDEDDGTTDPESNISDSDRLKESKNFNFLCH